MDLNNIDPSSPCGRKLPLRYMGAVESDDSAVENDDVVAGVVVVVAHTRAVNQQKVWDISEHIWCLSFSTK